MIVTDFKSNCKSYKDFQVWEIESIETFFKGNEVLSTIFQDAYTFPIEEFAEKREEIPENDFEIMVKMLDLVGDKSFFLFTLHDDNHLELVGMQQMKIMNFGIDIENIKKDHVYAMIMDKVNK